jgi:hypothetical protein
MSHRLLKRRMRKAGISTALFLIAIVVTVVLSAAVTYVLVSPGVDTITKTVADENPLNSISDMFPVSLSNDTTTVNDTTTSCYSGNWTALYQEYQAPLTLQNTTGMGQQYLNDSQFMSFLSQYLNLNDPWVNATVTGLLSNNETAFVQQQLQSQGLIC